MKLAQIRATQKKKKNKPVPRKSAAPISGKVPWYIVNLGKKKKRK